MNHEITITEISKCIVSVEADTYEEALEKVENEYWENPAEYSFDSHDTAFE